MLNTIGKEGNMKPPHEFHFPIKNSEHCLWFLLRSKSSMHCRVTRDDMGWYRTQSNMFRRKTEKCITNKAINQRIEELIILKFTKRFITLPANVIQGELKHYQTISGLPSFSCLYSRSGGKLWAEKFDLIMNICIKVF